MSDEVSTSFGFLRAYRFQSVIQLGNLDGSTCVLDNYQD